MVKTVLPREFLTLVLEAEDVTAAIGVWGLERVIRNSQETSSIRSKEKAVAGPVVTQCPPEAGSR